MAKATATDRVSTDRLAILVTLLALAAAAWAILAWQSVVMNDEMSLTMGLSTPLFIALWITMMVAIMFPAAAPMILMFARVHNHKRVQGDPFVPTWIFAGAYMLVWSATGIAAYALAIAGDALADESDWVMDNAPRIGGGVLILAGLYQLSPIKNVCLSKCRSPISFVFGSWRDGYLGSFRMGIDHAVFCLGCCWLLFIILFPLGMMNLAVLALITAVIFAEKTFSIGRQVAGIAAVALVLYGAFVIAVPDALPMTMHDDNAAMSDMEMSEGDEMPGMDDGMESSGQQEMPQDIEMASP